MAREARPCKRSRASESRNDACSPGSSLFRSARGPRNDAVGHYPARWRRSGAVMATGGGRRSVWLGLLLTVALSGSVFAAAEPTPAADRAASPSPARPAGHGGEALAEIDPADATDCRHPLKGASQGTASTVVLKLDPETIWRPRGGEVRFFFEGSGIMVRNVQVCFAWSPVDGGAQPASTIRARSSARSRMPRARSNTGPSYRGSNRHTAAGLAASLGTLRCG
jgi:hypothetical protein